MREAMETALQDRTAAPAELTVTWEEVCRYLDSLAARGRRRETIQVYRPKLEAFYHFLPEDKRVAADTLELWRCRPAAGRLLARYSQHPCVRRQWAAGLSGAAGICS